MQVYQLDNKQMDEDFLKGIPVKGKAFILADKQTPFEKNELILVVLSNGKKYKGKVINFTFFMLKEYQVGELEIIRNY